MFTFSTSTDDEKDNETLQKPEVSQFVETSCFWFRPTGVKKKKPKRPSCDLVRQSMLYHDHNNDYFIVDLEVLVFLWHSSSWIFHKDLTTNCVPWEGWMGTGYCAFLGYWGSVAVPNLFQIWHSRIRL